MSSSKVTDSPACVIRHKTLFLVSPGAAPHPQVGPVADKTVASAIQFAPFTEAVGVVACDVAGVACVGETACEQAGQDRTAVSNRSRDFIALFRLFAHSQTTT